MEVRDLERLDDWVPAALLAALRETAAGREIHLVGGALRDRWLGLPFADLDLVADGRAERLARRLARRISGRFVSLAGERFAAFRIVKAGLTVDLWGRGASPIRADLERRDLTINSLAVDLATGALLDPLGGIADLERRRLRASGPRAFAEDPLRVLRLARFAAALEGFGVVSATRALARRAAPAVEAVARERIRDEVTRILAAGGRRRGLEILAATGLYPRLWGGAEPAGGPAPGRLAGVGAARDELVAGLEPDRYECDVAVVCHALLFLPPGGGAEAAHRSPLLTRRERARVTDLLALGELPADESAGRWFVRRWGRRWCEAAVFALLRPAVPAPAPAPALAGAHRLAAIARRHGRRLLDLPKLLDGDQVARLLGLPPGPAIGRALGALEKEQVAGRVETASQARDFLLAWWRREND